MVKIASDFDSGNIEILDASDPTNIRLAIRRDGRADFYQWFYFKVEGARDLPLTLHLENAAGASYPGGWNDYRAVASSDGKDWTRVDTEYDGQRLTINVAPTHDVLWIAYFAPYPTSRHRAFVETVKHSGVLHHETLGTTIDGQPIDYFRLGAPDKSKLQYWIIGRQHPGESMGSWWMEGLFDQLLDPQFDPAAILHGGAVLHVAPMMNPDGVARGHLRTNAAGVDLNRAWVNTTETESPEVYFVRERMSETGVDFFLDVHGDETIPNNFLIGAQGVPNWSDHLQAAFDAYSTLLLEESDHFQREMGYPIPAPGKANINIAGNYAADTWKCLAMTLEMPFKDALVRPDPTHGWSPALCKQLARENLRVMSRFIRDRV